MELFRLNMALGTSLLNYKKEAKPYKDDHIFTDIETELFLRSLTWETELKEFKSVDTVVLRCKGNERILYTILKRKDKGFTLQRIIRAIRKCRPNGNDVFDIANISLYKKNNTLYFIYYLLD